MSAEIRIVLVNTSHPGNIGAVARAMKNMGLDSLHLVAPAHFPSAEASARASGADDVLARARLCASLDEAVAGCTLAFGASARSRSIPWPQLDPRRCAQRAVAEARRAPVALVFGRERTGLTNAELERCNYLVSIPSNPAFPALNIAAAVQVLAYELLLARTETDLGPARTEPLATGSEVQDFFDHLQRALVDIEFLVPDHPKQLMRRLRRLFNRVELERDEVNMLRGILTSAQRKAGK